MADIEQKNPRTKFKDSWILRTFGSFIATVLGIALTFGVSKINDRKAAKELQKQCVFNVLTDIDNVIMFSRQDSARVSEIGKWLPSSVEDYSYRKDFPKDTVVSKLCDLTGYPSYLRLHYRTIGLDIVNNIVPTDANDMMLHRLFGLAYMAIERMQNITKDIDQHMDKLLEILIPIYYSSVEYDNDEMIDIFFNNPDLLLFCNTVWQLESNDAIGHYIKSLEGYKQRIYDNSGLTEEDYKSFMESNSPKN